MNSTTYWLVCAIAVLLLALLTGAKQAPALTTKVCGFNITLPAKGKCVHFKRHGYSVKVCNK